MSAFAAAEYERRWAGVLAAVEAAGLDALVVTARHHIEYLTGHDAGGAYMAPYFLLAAPGRERVLVVRRYDERSVRADLALDVDVRAYVGAGDAVPACADALGALGLRQARLGLELDLWGLPPLEARRLEAAVPGACFEDASALVDAIAEVKSDAEIAVMRRAAALTDRGVEAFFGALREGVTEREAGAAVTQAIADGGGEDRGCALLFGERTALPHGQAGTRALRPGDVAFIETGAHVAGYAAGLCRTAVIGGHDDAAALHTVAEAAVDAAVAALVPGGGAGDVHRAAFGAVRDAGRPGTFLHRTGYAIGIDWYQRGATSLEPGAGRMLEPGMTFHLPLILFDERGRFGVGTSETVLVTPDGPDVLSRLPRALHVR